MQTYPVEALCAACGEAERIYVDPADYIRWIMGAPAQDAFPYLNADEREALITRVCLDCIDEMYRDLVEEDGEETVMGALDPESGFWEYERDWYVD